MISDPVIRPISYSVSPRESLIPRNRLEGVIQAAQQLREEMLSHSTVTYYQSFDLMRLPYPTRFALREARTVRTPFVHIINRLVIVQFQTSAGIRTLLISPSDLQRNRR